MKQAAKGKSMSGSVTWIPAALVAASLVWAAPAAPRAQQAIHQEEIQAAPDAVVEVDNLAGSVVVNGWSRDRVKVTGTLGRGAERLEVEGSGSRIRIRVVLPESRGERRERRIEGSDLTISVPTGSRLKVNTVSAAVEVSGIEGQAGVQTVSGAVLLKGRVCRAEINTVSGSIDMDAVEGLEEANLNTVSGHLAIDATRLDGGSYRLNTLSGDVTVRNAGGLAADWNVSTFSGQIDNEIGPPAERTSQYAPGQSVTFSTGGGSEIALNTFSGRIQIRRN